MISRASIIGKHPVEPLGDLVEFLDHMRRPVTESDRIPGPYPYYGANGQQGTISDYVFDEPLVLLAEDGGMFDQPDRGVAYRISGKTWVNNHAHVLRPTPRIDVGYLCRVLENYDLRPFVSGSTRGKLTKGSAVDIPIPVPPVSEQQRLAAILDQADALRAKRRLALAKLDSLPRSLFLDLFGDPVRDTKAWHLRRFDELGELDRGVSKNRPRNSPELLGGPYPLIQTGDIANSDGYIRSYTNTYSELGLKQSKLWPAGTLCITIAANIGKTALLTFDACFPDSVVGFRTNGSVRSEYIQTWLSFIQKHLEETAPQVAQKNINLATLRALHLPVPPLDLQTEFVRRLNSSKELRTKQALSLSMLDALFASLQHRAFRGEL